MAMNMRDLSNQYEALQTFEFDLNEIEEPLTDDWEVRYSLLKRVIAAHISDVEKLSALRRALDDPNQSVRYLAANALKNLKCEGVVDALLFALTDPFEWVRIRAIEGLGDRQAAEAVEPFIHYLDEDPDVKVRATLVKHLGRFGELRLIPVIAHHLADRDARVRANAIEGLGYYAPELVEHIIRPFVEDDNARIRANVAVVLAKGIDTEVSRGSIASMLASDNLFERMGAIYSIGETADETYLPILFKLLNDSSYVIQRNVCEAMVKFGIKLQGPLLKEIRLNKSEHFMLGAVRVLAQIADKKALKTLLKLQEFADGELRAAAEKAVDQICARVDGEPILSI